MGPERWESVDRVLRSVLDLDPQHRDAVLEQVCGDDFELRREVDSLLAHEAPLEGFLEAGPRDDSAEPEAPGGGRVGPYRIVRLLASGGMGTVWLAERADDQYRKRVAVKWIKRGMDTDEILRRFRNERQVQANLEHANIVRLLDGGAAEDGRPYLVMEYVEGSPILEYCEARRLSVPERLRLFVKVCRAVHYAHQNLVVHRDLKPSNILVTGADEPKLLDFGIAKVLQPGAEAGSSDLTTAGLRPMTTRYASPEQFRGETVTTATDVYSLGRILYEVLSGRDPYGAHTGSPAEYERAVREREPGPLSEAARGADPSRPGRRLRGDLDAIVRKAMRKEPGLRYASAEQFAQDIERHLEGLPVQAHRGTAAYRVERFVRRNALPVAIAAALFVALLAGAIGTARQAGIAKRERDLAVAATTQAQRAAETAGREARKSMRVTRFFENVLTEANPRKGGRGISALEALDRAVARVHEEFGGEPEIESAVRAAAGEVYTESGRYDAAADQLGRALGILERAGEGGAIDRANCLSRLGALSYAQGDYARARALCERALAEHRRLLGDAHADVARDLNDLAAIARAGGDVERAESLARAALDLRRSLFGEEHHEVAESMNNLAGALRARGDLAGAEELARRVLESRRKLLGDAHPDTVQSLDNLAVILAARGDLRGAEPLMREAVARYRESAGPNHPDLAVALTNLGWLLNESGGIAAAEVVLEEALRIRRSSLTPADGRTLSTARLLASNRISLKRFEGAEEVLRQARADAEAEFGAGNPAVAILVGDLVELYEAWARPAEAAALRALFPAGASASAGITPSSARGND